MKFFQLQSAQLIYWVNNRLPEAINLKMAEYILQVFGILQLHTHTHTHTRTCTHMHTHTCTQTEKALLDTGHGPESAEDFDRLLLAHPNNSALWVQYMAFYLHTAEADRARGVAERALKTISFR